MTLSVKQQLSQTETVTFVLDWLEANPLSSRTDLARAACRELDLRDAKGDWRLATTLKALRDLEAQDYWTLPQSPLQGPRAWNPIRLDQAVDTPKQVPKQAEDIKELKLVEVKDPEHLRIWNELVIGEHPLRDSRLVGRQLRYLIGSAHGWLGAIGFGSAALQLESRDAWIGWNPNQRMEHLPRVINMTRFLIRPKLQCKNLASHVLGLCARKVSADYERRYGLRPWLLESFVEVPTYQGSCYQGANWIKVGQTKGRGRNGQHDEGKTLKNVYLYPLVRDLSARVGVESPLLSPLDLESGLDSQSWAEQEFGNCQLGDKRLSCRLVKIACQQGAQPGGSYSQAAGGNRHDLKGYYRFFNSQQQEMGVESILRTHRTQTLRRMQKQSTVLVIQDTTDMNFSSRVHCEGLGQVGTNQTGAISRGLKLHSSMAVATNGLPLGVLGLHGYAPESAKDKNSDRPIQEKDSYRWLQSYEDTVEAALWLPDTRVVNVCDREGDIFELFDARRKQQQRKVDLLVRAKWDRCLEETENKLFEELDQARCAKKVKITVPRQREHKVKGSTPGRPALPVREAQVEVRFKEVIISPPGRRQTKNLQPIKLFAVYLLETNPPPGGTPVRWMLLTTVPVHSIKQAMKCLRWYCLRWRIEEWHRVLKSGCKILDHQNHTAEVLLRTIALDAVIAWRIMLLALLGREVPEMPCDRLFNKWECKVLELLAQKKTHHWRSNDHHCQTGWLSES